MKEKISITINKNLLRNIDSLIDRLYIRNRSQAIEYLIDKVLGTEKTAVILAGGDEESLRISPEEYCLTAKRGTTTVLSLPLKTLRKHNFKKVYLVARHKVLTKAFELAGDGSSHGIKLTYVEEKTSQGTFDTLKLLKGKISSNFLVVYGDIVFDSINLQSLWDTHSMSNAVATLLLTTSATPSQKGNVSMQGKQVLRFIQKPPQSDNYLVFSPIFVTEPEIFDRHGHSLELDVFPELTKKELLSGHLSPVKEEHVHKPR